MDEPFPAFVQITLPAPTAEILARALVDYLNLDFEVDREASKGVSEANRKTLSMLAEFFDDVAANPRGFPVTGRMATAIKKRRRLHKRAQAQPQPRARRRTRHAMRLEKVKRRKADRLATVAEYNERVALADSAGLQAGTLGRVAVLDGQMTVEEVLAEIQAEETALEAFDAQVAEDAARWNNEGGAHEPALD